MPSKSELVLGYLKARPYNSDTHGSVTNYRELIAKLCECAPKYVGQVHQQYNREQIRIKNQSLTLTEQKKNGKGETTSETFKLREKPTKFEFTADQVIGGTTNPNGSDWLKFTNTKVFGLDQFQIDQLSERLNGKIKLSKRKASSKVGIVDVADLHSGSVLKYMEETIKSKELITKY